MTALTTWVRAMVVVTVLCGVLRAVVPNGKMKGAFGFLCAAIVLSTALAGLPHLLAEKDALGAVFTTDAAVSESHEDLQRQAVLFAAQSSLQEQMETRLNNAGLPFSAKAVCAWEGEALLVKTLILSGSGTAPQRRQAEAILRDFSTENTTIVWETEETL